MKKIICILIGLCFLNNAYADVEQKMSMDDGVVFKGKVTSISAIKNLLATELILSCMKNLNRYDCQCGIDNVLNNMTADEIVNFNFTTFQEQFKLSYEKYCSVDAINGIPTTNSDRDMLGGELRTFISKEIIIDCIDSGENKNICRCYGEESSKIVKGKDLRKFLKIIDTRKKNMLKYKFNKKIYKECEKKQE